MQSLETEKDVSSLANAFINQIDPVTIKFEKDYSKSYETYVPTIPEEINFLQIDKTNQNVDKEEKPTEITKLTEIDTKSTELDRKKNSFMQTKAKLKSKLTAKLKEMSKMQSFAYGHTCLNRRRYTINNKPCASMYFHKGKLYRGTCVSAAGPQEAVNPFGTAEFCYEEGDDSNLGKNWAQCKPDMNWCQVAQATNAIKLIAAMGLKKQTGQILNIANKLQQMIQQENILETNLKDMNEKVQNIGMHLMSNKDKLQDCLDGKKQYKAIERLVIDTNSQIERAKIEQQQAKKQPQGNMTRPKPANMPSEEKENNEKLNMYIQQKETSNSSDCRSLDSYSGEMSSTGVNVKYYKNKLFQGSPVEKIEENVNFDWSGGPPIKGFSKTNFSVKVEGYLFIPHSGEFTFYLENDSGSSLLINNKVVIKNNFENKTQSESIFEKIIKKVVPSWLQPKKKKEDKKDKSKSDPIFLKGGQKIKFLITYFHSDKTSFDKETPAFLRLLWETNRIQKVLIQSKYFNKENEKPPASPSGNSANNCVIRPSRNFDLAFKDSDEYIIKDIPEELLGIPRIKYIRLFKESEIKVTMNTDSSVYIAFQKHLPPPVNLDKCDDTGLELMLAQIEKVTQPQKEVKILKESIMRVCQINAQASILRVPTNLTNLNNHGISITVFVKAQPGGVDKEGKIHSPVCSGQEKPIVSNSNEIYSKCSASSSSPSFSCFKGFDMNSMHFWKTNGRAVGEWVKMEFKNKVMLTNVVIRNSIDPAERTQEIRLSYSSGVEDTIKLPNSGAENTFKLSGQMTSFVQIKILKVYSSTNNALSFKFQGIECLDPENFKPKSSEEASKLLALGFNSFNQNLSPFFSDTNQMPTIKPLTCNETLRSNSNLNSLLGKDKVLITCVDGCQHETKLNIYGTDKYSITSSICRSALHADMIPQSGGRVYIKKADKCVLFTASEKNGVKSKYKIYSVGCFSFEKVPGQRKTPTVFSEGDKVDVQNPVKKTDYVAAIVVSIVNPTSNPPLIRIISEDQATNFKDDPILAGPPLVLPCGTKLLTRNCDQQNKTTKTNQEPQNAASNGTNSSPSNSSPTQPSRNIITIVFGKEGSKVTGGEAFIDNGKILGQHKGPYGWSDDIQQRVLTETNIINLKNANDSLIAFTPDANSLKCRVSPPNPDCKEASWSIFLQDGNYKVTVTVGNPKLTQLVNLQANGDAMATNMIVRGGELKVLTKEMMISGQLVLTTECENDCENAEVFINKIEIVKLDEDLAEKTNQDQVSNPQGGSPYTATKKDPKECEIGTDVASCVYENNKERTTGERKGMHACYGTMHLVYITQYSKFKEDAGKLKCTLKEYPSTAECNVNCPNKCDGKKCN